jgi:CheY-like chemotaxis protein
VVIGDEREDDRRLYAEDLALRGIRVEEAVDGVHAIFKVATLLPDLVVMDVSMLGLDGLSAAAELKTHPRTQHIPLIILTAHATAEALESATKARTDIFLTKPCAPTELWLAIEQLLSLKSTRPRR